MLTFLKRRHLPVIIIPLAAFFLNACKGDKTIESDSEFTNDLIHETSPYLLQHANNPVNWKAWNDNLFETSTQQDKLVIISIGYSSCHWCHVMERETFEDLAVAQLMNDKFISIKVDREERPDVDEVYQRAIQLVNQSGGWPLNVIALPNGKPLYLGTYLPKKQWGEVLDRIYNLYLQDPEKANDYANRLAQGIQDLNVMQPSSEFDKLTSDALAEGVTKWQASWDLENGGNAVQEKFMIPNALNFLLDYASLNNDQKTNAHVKNTLNKIALGGIYDHLGGGFYRYSTDPYWKVPHFEKMLYDNAQAISLYTKAYTRFKEPHYKDIVYETIGFLEREMKSPEGGYYATLNAESEGVEGKFYTWSKPELQSILEADFALFSAYYNIEETKAWQNGSYVLHQSKNDIAFSNAQNINVKTLKDAKRSWRKKLFVARDSRVRPTTDDKILTSWNAMLIRAFADAYAAFGDKQFLAKATTLFTQLQKQSYQDGSLKHSFKKGSTNSKGFLEDYAFLIDASLALYKVTQEVSYLNFSKELTNNVVRDFSDASSGMFSFNKDQKLIAKIVKTNDGDIPSPNSVMAHNLLQLGHIDYNVDYLNKSKTMLTTLLPMVTEYTDGFSNWGSLMLHVTKPYFEIVVVGNNAPELRAELQKKYIPNALIIGSSKESEIALFKDRYEADQTFIYVCQNSTCKLPVTSINKALKQIKNF